MWVETYVGVNEQSCPRRDKVSKTQQTRQVLFSERILHAELPGNPYSVKCVLSVYGSIYTYAATSLSFYLWAHLAIPEILYRTNSHKTLSSMSQISYQINLL